jgi:hypothetical protein
MDIRGRSWIRRETRCGYFNILRKELGLGSGAFDVLGDVEVLEKRFGEQNGGQGGMNEVISLK